ncbi:unnamed protein product [Trifolium pratense]|uniref:Uncharacterized protein n=1 Tax=Trifolium pratense TaxID=57577 RepID=A0ACB0K9Q0_TRIPR|nr:unnamed protein product [Trifolium pratense]
MLALDKPYVASSVECDIETSEEFCLEYGNATQLYLVPYIQHEEQACVEMTPNHHQGSRQLGSYNATRELRFSQASLPCDSLGTIDFSNYPFRVCRVWLVQNEYYYVNTRFLHSLCGHFVDKKHSGFVECSFCHLVSDVRTYLPIQCMWVSSIDGQPFLSGKILSKMISKRLKIHSSFTTKILLYKCLCHHF